MAMRTEDFTALVDALLPDDDGGTAAFLHAKQAALVALGVRQLLFFLAETTPLRSHLAEEANATSLMELLGKCGLAAEDDLRHVRNPPAPATLRSLSAPEQEASQQEDSGFTDLAATEQHDNDSSMGATEDSAPQFRPLSAEDSQPHEDGTTFRSLSATEPETSQAEDKPTDDDLRQRAQNLMAGNVDVVIALLREIGELKEQNAEFQKRLEEAQEDMRRAQEEVKGIRFGNKQTTARRVLSLVMRAAFKQDGKDTRDIFQPCKADLELLKIANSGEILREPLHV